MSFAFVVLLPLLASQPAQTNVAEGSWQLSTHVNGNAGTPMCEFKQDGVKLSGTCTTPDEKKADATGEVTDKKITFRYDIQWEGSPLTLVYTGTLESENDIKGTVDVQPVGVAGEFTAKKGCGC